MMLLLRDRLIIIFKEIDIILNRVFRTILPRARNYVRFAIRGGYRIIIFTSICSEFPISSGFIASPLNGKERERERIWIQVNHFNYKQNCAIITYTYFIGFNSSA